MQQIQKLVRASKKSSDGAINAVVEVTWQFVVTVAIEKDEIENIDEEALRDMLGDQVGEMVSMTKNPGDAIEIGHVLEVRDGDTEEMITLDEIDTPASEDVIPVAYWDSKVYGEGHLEPDNGKDFQILVDDRRESVGQLFVDVIKIDGEDDDMLAVTLEINRLPGSKTDVPCAHLHFDNDRVAASFFKQDNRFIVRPETDVTIRDTVLPDGERAWIIEE